MTTNSKVDNAGAASLLASIARLSDHHKLPTRTVFFANIPDPNNYPALSTPSNSRVELIPIAGPKLDSEEHALQVLVRSLSLPSFGKFSPATAYSALVNRLKLLERADRHALIILMQPEYAAIPALSRLFDLVENTNLQLIMVGDKKNCVNAISAARAQSLDVKALVATPSKTKKAAPASATEPTLPAAPPAKTKPSRIAKPSKIAKQREEAISSKRVKPHSTPESRRNANLPPQPVAVARRMGTEQSDKRGSFAMAAAVLILVGAVAAVTGTLPKESGSITSTVASSDAASRRGETATSARGTIHTPASSQPEVDLAPSSNTAELFQAQSAATQRAPKTAATTGNLPKPNSAPATERGIASAQAQGGSTKQTPKSSKTRFVSEGPPYAIRLATFSDALKRDRFIAANSSDMLLHYIDESRNDRAKYAVVTGSYNGFSLAREAIKDIPVRFIENNPYVVSIANKQLSRSKPN